MSEGTQLQQADALSAQPQVEAPPAGGETAAADSTRLRAEQTLRYERIRALATGVVDSITGTFLLLIALKHFHAGDTAKACLASAGSIGLLLTPLVVHAAGLLGWTSSRAAALLAALGALGFLIPVLLPGQVVYVFGCVMGAICVTSYIPLLTQIYQENYPAAQRGQLFSRIFFIRIAATAAMAYLFGELLAGDMNRFRIVLSAAGLGMLINSFCLLRCPSRPVRRASSANPLASLKLVSEDVTFRRILMSWMLMGFANLVMIPLRIEYLGNPKYGLGLKADAVALLTGVIPNLTRLALTGFFGRLFDRMNFFILRMSLNGACALAIVAFFTGDSVFGLIAGAMIFGVSMAGGDVAWNLWVIKVAPADRVAEYMAVHTFLTGARGLVAPFAGFYLLNTFSMGWMALMCAMLILVGTLILLTEARDNKFARAKIPAPDACD
jgi:MFS family permease